MKPHTANCRQSGRMQSRKFTASIFETLESRQMMSRTFMPMLTGPVVGLILQPIIVNGTPYGDFITVSYSNDRLFGPRIVVKVNPTNVNPGYIVFPKPGQGVQINGLGGNDVIRYSGSLGANIYGGEGNDTITGGSGSDYLDGGAGNDHLDGGLGSDVIFGGPGVDTVDYSRRTGNLTVTTEGASNDGEAGEHDNIMGDIEVLIGGSGHDRLNFFSSHAGWHKLVGNGGNDTLIGSNGPDIIIGGHGNDLLSGNYGDDYMIGEDGNDTLRGSYGRDLLSGGRGNDLLYGDGHLDTLYGDEGDDTMYGGYAADTLYGGSGNDLIYGEEGDDLILGENDHDRLYGGEGADTIYGGNGNDGLFGGNALHVDRLNGGAGADRFLFQSGDVIADLTAADARINFRNGQQITLSFTGQNGTYTFAGRNWSDTEIQNIDTALNVLHHATGNTRLLKKANRTEMTFVRQGAQTSSSGGTFSAAAWNSNGQVHFVTPTLANTLHEVGHNWDTEYNATGWNTLSGWTQADMSTNPSYRRGGGNDGWWHLTTAQFANEYGRTNPFEDFAMSFEVNMLRRGGLPNVNSVVAVKNSFIDNMISHLAANA